MTPETPSGPSRFLLGRGTLLEKLDDAVRKPVTLLLAPAGAGKSVLLGQWMARQGTYLPVTLRLTNTDNQPGHFLGRLLEATGITLDHQHTGTSLAGNIRSVLDKLPTGTLLILDNFENVDTGPVCRAWSELLEVLPDNLHIILSGRTIPDLPLARHTLNDHVSIVDQGDLRLETNDIISLARRKSDTGLSVRQANALLSRTEGWMAGIIFALQAMNSGETRSLSRFGGNLQPVAQYFEDEVMGRMTSTQRSLLLKLSVFEAFSGALANALLDTEGAARELEQLSRRELFVTQVPGKPDWFRCHISLRQFLLARLRNDQPGAIPSLHRLAVHWFLTQSEYESALHHAIECQDQAVSLRVLEECVDYWCREGYFAKVVEWARRFPDQDMLSVPGLVVPLIRSHTLARRFSRAQRYLDLLRQNIAHGTRLCDDITLRYLELKLELFQDDTDFRKRKDLEDFLQTAKDHWIYPFALAVSAYHHAQNARFDLALRHAEHAREALLSTGQNFLSSYMDLIIAMCNRNTGRITNVIRDVHEAYEATPESCPAHNLYSAAMVVMLYEQNREKEAADICSELLPVLDQTSATEAVTAVYLVGSRVFRSCGNQSTARRMLDQLASILCTGNYERFTSQLTCETIRQQLADGHKDQMERSREVRRLRELLDAGEWDKPRPYTETWERNGIATAYWLIQHQRYGTASRILRVIANVLEQVGIVNRLIVVRAILITITDQEKGREIAYTELQQLIADFTLVNITRTVYDEAPGIGPILDQAGREGRVPVPDVYRNMFDNYLNGETGNITTNLTKVLTGKELEIFSYLLRGLSNAEISRATSTTVATTKWHLKNIYSKLKVSNRTEAILKAPRDISLSR